MASMLSQPLDGAHFDTADAAPPSPAAFAAATTLAALADSRADDDEEDDDDDDDDDDAGGGISITSADLHYYTATTAAQLHSVMAQLHSFPHAAPLPLAFDPFAPVPSYHMPNMHLSMPSAYASHGSSSEPSLEPPLTLQEAHLSIQDRGSFVPITSFFHYLTPAKPAVPGLELVQVPPSVSRDDLQGDRYDAQGIDWAARNTTRAHIRAKRFEYETEKLPRYARDSRQVRRPSPERASLTDTVRTADIQYRQLLRIQEEQHDPQAHLPTLSAAKRTGGHVSTRHLLRGIRVCVFDGCCGLQNETRRRLDQTHRP
jgi:hypothetical protein